MKTELHRSTGSQRKTTTCGPVQCAASSPLHWLAHTRKPLVTDPEELWDVLWRLRLR